MSYLSDLREEIKRLKAEIELLNAQGDAQTNIELSILVSHLTAECEKTKAELIEFREVMPKMVDSVPWASKLVREDCIKRLDKVKAERDELRFVFDLAASKIIPGEVDTSDAYLKLFYEMKSKLVKYRAALEFYAERLIYEKLNKFPGDNEVSECSDIAKQALEEK